MANTAFMSPSMTLPYDGLFYVVCGGGGGVLQARCLKTLSESSQMVYKSQFCHVNVNDLVKT